MSGNGNGLSKEGRKKLMDLAKRIVIKVGSNVLTTPEGKLDLNKMMEIAEIVSKLKEQGKQVILVSSGAVAAGKMRLGLNGGDLKKLTLGMQQSSAAIGQSILMEHYNNFFAKHHQIAAQLLLTPEDFADELRHANVQSTLDMLLSLNAVPIVNENDPVSVDELGICLLPEETLSEKMKLALKNKGIYLEKCLPGQKVFGDNDMLSALVAKTVSANLLVLLSDVDGLYTCNPKGENANAARLIDHVLEIDEDMEKMAAADCGDNGRGGMASKVKAAKYAASHGTPVIIANGKNQVMLPKLFQGERVGTFFETKQYAEEKTLEGKRDVREKLTPKLTAAKNSTTVLGIMADKEKNEALLVLAKAIRAYSPDILAANQLDVDAAKRKGVKDSLVDRLTLNANRIEEMAKMCEFVSSLKDPVGEKMDNWAVKSGLNISKIRVPIGVIGVIYESRPNVTVDSVALCLKSGNAIILKGGSDALNSNIAIVKIVRQALRKTKIPEEAVQFLDGGREEANELMKASSYVDLIVPRGGANLIDTVRKNSVVPVLETGVGNCHIYVDKEADLEMARKIVLNAKCQRPGTCNAAEKLLIHKDVAASFLPNVAKELHERKVELRCDKESMKILENSKIPLKLATEEDWKMEYLDLIMGIKIVNSLEEAILHIGKYGTKHSEAIITKNSASSTKFMKEIDAAALYHNASTRFTDGSEFGFGAEIGISTQKLHARGPVGLRELTSYKYLIEGAGQVRGG
ncbi:glutamate-5-semialdehyde dehydrogenase [Candidatus Micrarchaeota archaeon]|nr:glutamate-5-semialdehyde dehydrogenase [Candidatus Micrarchaeota archaeon]